MIRDVANVRILLCVDQSSFKPLIEAWPAVDYVGHCMSVRNSASHDLYDRRVAFQYSRKDRCFFQLTYPEAQCLLMHKTSSL